jgi:hypothetical protein
VGVKVEDLLSESPTLVVHYDHALVAIGNATFVGNIGSSECIISCNHDHPNMRFLQLMNGRNCLRFQLVLKYLKTIESQLLFSLFPGELFIIVGLQLLAGDGQHSESVGCVFFQHFSIIWRNCAF